MAQFRNTELFSIVGSQNISDMYIKYAIILPLLTKFLDISKLIDEKYFFIPKSSENYHISVHYNINC